MTIPQRVSDINSLSPSFRKKFDMWRKEVIAKYPTAGVFEARRSLERQKWLYAQGRTRPGKIVTRTLKSKHLTGDAVDIIFYDAKGNPTWLGPYNDLIAIAKKYGIDNLAPTETCHFQDNGLPIIPPKPPVSEKELEAAKALIKANSFMRDSTEDPGIRESSEDANKLLRGHYGLP